MLVGEVTERDGELATVRTEAGPVRALGPPGAEAVEVWIRADAVTITDPDDTPDPSGTSARNRFPGTVREINRGRAIARVTIDIGAESPLTALVTIDSVNRLGLAPDREIIVTWKATATRARDREALD